MPKCTRRGRATGVPMLYEFLLPKVRGRPPVLPPRSREGKLRLRPLEYAQIHSVAAACRHLGFARSTYYRWRHRYVPSRPATLETRSSRPIHTRRPAWTTQEVLAVRDLVPSSPAPGKTSLPFCCGSKRSTSRSP
ncbi:MAG: helix-turn-helix domain-containing protein [Chloroflexota bacterium]